MQNKKMLGDILKRILQERGEEAFRNPQYVLAMFSDLAPMMKKEKELLRAFLNADGAAKILNVKNSGKQDQKQCMDSVVRTMRDSQWVSEDAAQYICGEFYRSVTNREWIFEAKKAKVPAEPVDLDVRKSVTVKREDLQKDYQVKIEVDGNKTDLKIPASVSNGQTVCYPGKGRFDSANQVYGDLYVTVNIIDSSPVGGMKKGAVVALTVVVLIIVGIWLFGRRDMQQDNQEAIVNNVQTHTHSWKAATCDSPQTCSTCGATSGTAKGHSWTAATYTAPKTCSTCGKTEGSVLVSPEEQKKKEVLELAADYADKGEYRRAIQILDDAWIEYKDQVLYDTAADYRQKFAAYQTSFVAAGKYNSILRYSDGTVLVTGDPAKGELAANSWSDVISVGIGDRHVMALRSDGSVLIEGEEIQHPARNWTNVVAISSGDVHTLALLKNGTIIADGYDDHGQKTKIWKIMTDAGDKRIVAIAAGHYQNLALLENGRVVAAGDNDTGACNVSGWVDIAAIYTGTDYSAGLRTDGTVVVTRTSWDVSDWTDMVMLAAGDYYLLGLKSDGTVLSVGKCSGIDVSSWKNIVHISAGHDHAVAIDKDGHVLCAGSNLYGQHFADGTKIK